MLTNPSSYRGVSLIELMIAIAVLGILMAVAAPSYRAWIQNAQVRSAAESIVSGLQLARTEALRRNGIVRFQLVSTMDARCEVDGNAPNWIVSRADPSGACDADASDVVNPLVIQKKGREDGTGNVFTSSTNADGAANALAFNGLGRIETNGLIAGVPVAALNRIDISNPTTGSCRHEAADGEVRCMRVLVSPAGQIRMCDPAVTAGDPRAC